jgi:hypothetical protein
MLGEAPRKSYIYKFFYSLKTALKNIQRGATARGTLERQTLQSRTLLRPPHQSVTTPPTRRVRAIPGLYQLPYLYRYRARPRRRQFVRPTASPRLQFVGRWRARGAVFFHSPDLDSIRFD